MAEYIEREALLNNRPEGRNPIQTGKQEYNLGWNDCRHTFVECILGEPAADVAPVVRCRDCKHITPVEGGLPLCALHNIARAYNDFCSDGARMDGE